MNILVICIGGISTNVLVNRLNTYSKANGHHDTFKAVNIHSYDEFLQGTDVILLAPQAKNFKQVILDKCQKHNIPVIMLDEKDFSFNDMERIYQTIPQTKCLSSIQSETNHRIDLDFLRYVLVNTVITLCIILGLGLIPTLITLWFDSIWLKIISQITLGVVSIYLCLSVGYFSGKYMGVNCLVTSLIALCASIQVFPMNGVGQVTVAGNVQILTSYIDLKNWGLLNAPIILILSMLASVLFILAYQKNFLRDKITMLHPQMVSYIASIIPSTLVIGVFLLIRLFIVWVL